MVDVQSMLNTPLTRIKLVTAAHFILLVLALQDDWFKYSYPFYNIIFILMLLWSIKDSMAVEPVHFAAGINFASFFFDLLTIIKNFPDTGGVFGLIFAILNLVLRPFTLILINRELLDRGGTLMPTLNRVQQTYEDIPGRNAPGVAQVTVSNIFMKT